MLRLGTHTIRGVRKILRCEYYIEKMRTETLAWEEERNLLASKVSWHFRTQNAREKLLSLYPKYGPIEEEEKSSVKNPTTKSKEVA